MFLFPKPILTSMLKTLNLSFDLLVSDQVEKEPVLQSLVWSWYVVSNSSNLALEKVWRKKKIIIITHTRCISVKTNDASPPTIFTVKHV